MKKIIKALKNYRNRSLSIKFILLIIPVFYCCSLKAQSIPVNEPDYNKPSLFADIPERINVTISQLNSLFGVQAGNDVSVFFDGHLQYNGKLLSVTSKTGNRTSIVIKSTNRLGSILNITRTINTDNSVSFTGRIISFQHIDCFVLNKEPGGGYVFIKKQFYELVNE